MKKIKHNKQGKIARGLSQRGKERNEHRQKKRERKTGSRRSHSSFVSSDSWCKCLWDTKKAWSYFWWSKIVIKWLPVAGRDLEGEQQAGVGHCRSNPLLAIRHPCLFPSHPTFGTLEQRDGSADIKGHSLPVPVQKFGMGMPIILNCQ